MATWTLYRDGETIDTNLFDVRTTDSANPFGDTAVATIDDVRGQQYDKYPFGTRIDLEATPNADPDNLTISSGETVTTASATTDTYGGTIQNAGTYSNAGTVENQSAGITDFQGFVVERQERDQQGADVLELIAYTFDQFLRKSDVTNDQAAKSIQEALKDIIETDTPVTYDASNVSVGDNVQLTQSLQDLRVETALQILAFKSENEAFGVNANLEFFFRERETEHNDRGISNDEWFEYDIPERGKEAVNEVEVRYNDGTDKIIVDNPGQKLDLQDNLDLPDPGTQRTRINRPNITDAKDAEDEGRRFLKFRNATLSGTVTTYGLYDLAPFDTIDVEIRDRGIDEEFIVTKVEKNWGRDTTRLTLVENRGYESDFIVRLAEKTERLDLEGTDPDAAEDRVTTTNIGVDLAVSADVGGTSADGTRFVNPGRNKLRNGWTGDGTITVADVALGTDGSGLSRSNTALRNQVTTAAASESLSGGDTASYSATFTQSGVEEVGLLDSNGDLLARAVLDSPVDLNSDTVTVTIQVQNDSDVDRGVITNGGQTTVRDILADNSPDVPTQYAYGSGDTPPEVTDSSLETQEYSSDLTQILIQSADSSAQLDSITPPFAATDPIEIVNGVLQVNQTSFTLEMENGTSSGTSTLIADRFSGSSPTSGAGVSVEFDGDNQTASVTFTPQHDITESNLDIQIRQEAEDGPSMQATLNGDTWDLGLAQGFTGTLSWIEFSDNNADSYSGGTLSAGTTYTLTLESTSPPDTNSGRFNVDVVAIQDNRYSYTFDNTTTTGPNGGSWLDGPELYPDSYTQPLETATTRREVDTATVSSTWTDNDTSNNQAIELSNDGGSTYKTLSNTATGSVTFANLNADVDTRLTLSRYGTRDTATPRTGYKGQGVDLWELFANPDAIVADGIGESNTRAIIPRSDLTNGDTLTEAGHLDSNGDLLTRSVFADVEITSQLNDLLSSETVTFRP